MTDTELFEKAIELLQTNGWGRGPYRAPKMCIQDALWEASIAISNCAHRPIAYDVVVSHCETKAPHECWDRYTAAAYRCLETLFLNHYEAVGPDPVARLIRRNLACWNDASERSYEDVVLLLKQLAAEQ